MREREVSRGAGGCEVVTRGLQFARELFGEADVVLGDLGVDVLREPLSHLITGEGRGECEGGGGLEATVGVRVRAP